MTVTRRLAAILAVDVAGNSLERCTSLRAPSPYCCVGDGPHSTIPTGAIAGRLPGVFMTRWERTCPSCSSDT